MRFLTRVRGIVHAVMLVACGALMVGGAPAQASYCASESETSNSDAQVYEIKAAMTEKFLRYIDWPSSRFKEKEAPMIVGVFGKDPFGSALDKAFEGRDFNGHGIEIRRVKEMDGVAACHVLYVPNGEVDNLPEIAKAAKGKSVLLIGESPDFAKRGGIINFYLDEQKVRFEVNKNAAKRERLTISSKLLKLARIVEEEDE